jgi:hypothetical protein
MRGSNRPPAFVGQVDEINVNLNSLDRPNRGLAGIYVFVLHSPRTRIPVKWEG